MSESGVLAQVAAQVHSRPQHTALVYLASPTRVVQHTTYAELWAAATALALRLRRKTALGTRVGVALPAGPALPVLQLAIVLAGCAIVPLPVTDPVRRLALILQDARLSLVVTADEAGSATLHEAVKLMDTASTTPPPPSVITLALLHSQAGPLDPSSDTTAPSFPLVNEPRDDDHVTHVFFTSGSTGRPKGCLGTLAALGHYCRAKNIAHGIIGGQSTVFVASTPTFDPFFLDTIATWCAGATLALAAPTATFASLAAVLRRTHASHVCCTPSLFRTLPDAALATLPALKFVALGGEPTTLAETKRWWGHLFFIFSSFSQLFVGFFPSQGIPRFHFGQHVRPDRGVWVPNVACVFDGLTGFCPRAWRATAGQQSVSCRPAR
jgi:acyl-CoA synthetase (AMP-forming)/AMP-acid ligase II